MPGSTLDLHPKVRPSSVKYNMQALQKALLLEDEEFAEFCSELEHTGAIVAGELPMLLYAEPRLQDWHGRTRREVLLFCWVAKHKGLNFPRLVYETVGYWLQLLPLIQLFKFGQLNIDVITRPGKEFQTHSLSRCWYPYSYNVIDDCVDCITLHLGSLPRQTRLRIKTCNQQHDHQPHIEVDKYLTPFQQVTLDSPRPIYMRDRFDLDRFQQICDTLLASIPAYEEYFGWRYDADLEGRLGRVKRDALQQIRIIKSYLHAFDSWRFTFSNRQQVECLIDEFQRIADIEPLK